MYLKVLIMEVKEKYCLAMTQEGEIIRIKRKDGMKTGDRIFVLREDFYNEENMRKENKNIIPWKSISAVAAAFGILAGVALYKNFLEPAYATVSVDGAMSLQFEVNQKGVVKNAVSYDHTVGEQTLKELTGKQLEEVQDVLFREAGKSQKEWLVSYAFYKEGMQDKDFEEELENILSGAEPLYIKGNKEDVQEAEKRKKTLGMYLLEKAAEENDLEDLLEEIPVEKLAGFMSTQPEFEDFIKQIRFMTEENEEKNEKEAEEKEEKEEKEKEKREDEKEKREDEKEKREEEREKREEEREKREEEREKREKEREKKEEEKEEREEREEEKQEYEEEDSREYEEDDYEDEDYEEPDNDYDDQEEDD